jgi:hypothetical protein
MSAFSNNYFNNRKECTLTQSKRRVTLLKKTVEDRVILESSASTFSEQGNYNEVQDLDSFQKDQVLKIQQKGTSKKEEKTAEKNEGLTQAEREKLEAYSQSSELKMNRANPRELVRTIIIDEIDPVEYTEVDILYTFHQYGTIFKWGLEVSPKNEQLVMFLITFEELSSVHNFIEHFTSSPGFEIQPMVHSSLRVNSSRVNCHLFRAKVDSGIYEGFDILYRIFRERSSLSQETRSSLHLEEEKFPDVKEVDLQTNLNPTQNTEIFVRNARAIKEHFDWDKELFWRKNYEPCTRSGIVSRKWHQLRENHSSQNLKLNPSPLATKLTEQKF